MIDYPVEDYFAHALRLKPEEERLIAEFTGWLPDEIIDCHAHCNLREHVGEMQAKTRSHMLSTFPYYSIQASKEALALFHPGKHIRTLRFAKTFRGVDHVAANEYLLSESPEEDRIALFCLPERLDYTVGMMDHPRVSALKAYYSYVDPTAEYIYQYFTPQMLEEAQARDLPIILHLPKNIVKTIQDLLRLISDFPRLRISLAHLGLSKMPIPGLEEAFQAVAPYENVRFDTALNPSAEVTEMGIRAFGVNRIMYGSDEPLHLIRSVPFQHPERGERIVTDYPYHWADPEERAMYGHLATHATHAHWLCLKALRTSIDGLPSARQDDAKERIFFQNAKEFFGF